MAKCTFIGSIAPLQTAIVFHSEGGMRVKLDIPANQEGAALELLAMREKTLRITIEVDAEGIGSEQSQVNSRRATKQRV